jgi:hypothetical protein
MPNLPEGDSSFPLKPVLIGFLIFLFGAAVGAGGFYVYSTKVLIPKYKTQIMNEMFSTQSPEWGDFFKKVEEEKTPQNYTNPFEGTGGGTSNEDYVNPFDVIE